MSPDNDNDDEDKDDDDDDEGRRSRSGKKGNIRKMKPNIMQYILLYIYYLIVMNG